MELTRPAVLAIDLTPHVDLTGVGRAAASDRFSAGVSSYKAP